MENDINLPIILPSVCAPREELMRVLDGAARKRFIYIQAAGGYGKSVSALLWLKKSGLRAAWHVFDEYDDAPALFYRSFCLALTAAVPQEKEIADIIRSAAFSKEPVEHTLEFLTRADFGDEKIAFVLDDLHAVTNEAVEKTLPFALKRLPPNIIAIFLSRGIMPASFGMLPVAVLDDGDLTFGTDEVREYFACYGYSLTEYEAEEIRSYTNGMIVLLNTIVQSGDFDLKSDNPQATFKNLYNGFWDNLSDDKKRFLMKTAVPDKFTLELCVALTGEKDGKYMLDMLITGNANLSYADGEYRYHQLFLEFLREKLTESSSSENPSMDLPAAYKTAAVYYLDRNDTVALRLYALKSGDTDIINKSVRSLVQGEVMPPERFAELASIYNPDELPQNLREKAPTLCVPLMLIALFTGNRRDFECYANTMCGKLPQFAEEYPEWLKFAAFYLVTEHQADITALNALNISAKDCPNEIKPLQNITPQTPFLHRSFHGFFAHSANGEMFGKTLSALLPDDCAPLLSGIKAGLFLEQNRLAEAREALIQADRQLSDKTSVSVYYAIHIMSAEVSLFLPEYGGTNNPDSDNRDETNSNEHNGNPSLENSGDFYADRNFAAYETRTRLWNNDKTAAEEWLSGNQTTQTEFGYLCKVFQNLTTARAYIVLGDSVKALNALQEIKAVSETFGRFLDAAEADVLTALSEWGTGRKKESRERLERVLKTLFKQNYIRVVANEGKSILPVIKSVLNKHEKDSAKNAADPNHEAFSRYLREVYTAACEQSKKFKGLTHQWERKPVKLSPKQTLILELLAKGYKNAEIVEEAGLSINTIRSYTRIAYQKLEVNCAMDAIVKARRLGILK